MDRTETPDLGKVIMGLRCCTKVCEVQFCVGEGCPYALVPDDCINVLMSDALALLKAQEPVKPSEPDEYGTQYCGACGSAVGYELESPVIGCIKYNYCPSCGKPVKWDG